jgi:ABC-type polysaccharide/polyol phosphate export permease
LNILKIKLNGLIPLFYALLKRDLREKYAGSNLGLFWGALTPILQILVFWLVFSKFFKIKIPVDQMEIPFLPFLLSGMLPWLMFQEGVARGAGSIVEKGSLIKKIQVPIFIFSALPVFSSLIIYGFGIICFILGLIIWRSSIEFIPVLIFIIILFLQIVFTCGINLILSSLTVYIRDITQAIGFVLQFMLYLTTILYPMQMVPKEFQPIIKLNPLTLFIESYHITLLYNKIPPADMLVPLIAFTLLSITSGLFVYKKLKRGFQDVL